MRCVCLLMRQDGVLLKHVWEGRDLRTGFLPANMDLDKAPFQEHCNVEPGPK